jgi:hypothetical protein
LRELKEGRPEDGSYALALVEVDGDEKKAHVEYLRRRGTELQAIVEHAQKEAAQASAMGAKKSATNAKQLAESMPTTDFLAPLPGGHVASPQSDRSPEAAKRKAYAAAFRELKEARAEDGLYAMVLVECEGNEKRAHIEYIRRRGDELLARTVTSGELGGHNDSSRAVDDAGGQPPAKKNDKTSLAGPPIPPTPLVPAARPAPPVQRARQGHRIVDAGKVQELLLLCRRGDALGLRRCIEQSPDILAVTDDDGNTALHLAVLTRNEKLVRALVDSGADVNAPNNRGHSPLDWAQSGKLDGIARLMEGR